MKKTIFFIVTVSVLCTHLFAQEVVAVKTGASGTWQELGTINVDFKLNHDDIVLMGPAEFKSFKFKVFDAPVQILNMNVIYQNGKVDQMNIKYLVQPGAESRVIDLKPKGGVKDSERKIRRITVWYQSATKGNQGKARLVLWGMKS
jgi:hypothetical protein